MWNNLKTHLQTKNIQFKYHYNGKPFVFSTERRRIELRKNLFAQSESNLMERLLSMGYFQKGLKSDEYLEIALFEKDITVDQDTFEEYIGSSDGWDSVYRTHHALWPYAYIYTLKRMQGYVLSIDFIENQNGSSDKEVTVKLYDGTIKKMRATGDDQFFMARHL